MIIFLVILQLYYIILSARKCLFLYFMPTDNPPVKMWLELCTACSSAVVIITAIILLHRQTDRQTERQTERQRQTEEDNPPVVTAILSVCRVLNDYLHDIK